MIFVLAGTTEGREAASLLQQNGLSVGASVVSAYGSQLLHPQGDIFINQGRLDCDGLSAMLIEKEVTLLVDATHPYAIEISKLAIKVTSNLHIPYIRLERQSTNLPDHPLLTRITSIEEIETLLQPNQRVFSTLGSKSLPILVPLIKKVGAELVVRVLPCLESLQICQQLGIGPENIVALKSPFSKDLNKALFEQYQADVMVTKESGNIGGIDEKIAAAIELAIPVVVVTRPTIEYPLMVSSPEELLSTILQKK